MKARKRYGSAQLNEPGPGWQRGMELLLNGTCPWCFKQIDETFTYTKTLTWWCRGRCNPPGERSR